MNSVKKAQEWLKECEKELYLGLKPEKTILPSRVLDIGLDTTSTKICLETWDHCSREYGFYTTLSYCWGSGQTHKLTRTTLQDYKSTIPIDDLPLTIRHAILLTRALNVRYLWVDSLCIVQDDEMDTAREISKIPEVYENSLLTISAASAHDCQQGFLGVRPPASAHTISFRLGFKAGSCSQGSIYLTERDCDYDPGAEPTKRRAWTLQEIVLSPRTLVFGMRQLRWVCRFWQDSGGWYEDSFQKETLPVSMYFNSGIGIYKLPREEWFSSDWTSELGAFMSLVTEYTSCQLSFPEDKLPAFSGIAGKYGSAFGDRYLAGLWQSYLPCLLLWHVGDRDGSYGREILLPRPIQYRAPSWSWASVDGRVDWEDTIFYKRSDYRKIKILNGSVRLINESAPYGAVSSGTLTIRGPLQAARFKQVYGSIRWDSSKGDCSPKEASSAVDLPRWHYSMNVKPDTTEDWTTLLAPDRGLWLFLVGSPVDDDPSSVNNKLQIITGLILASVDLQSFRRIGYFSCTPLNVWEPPLAEYDWNEFLGKFKLRSINIE